MYVFEYVCCFQLKVYYLILYLDLWLHKKTRKTKRNEF